MNKENIFGIKIRQRRKTLGLTQEQLAEKIGIDNKHLSKIENGIHLPTYKTIRKLANTLQIDFSDCNEELSLLNSNPIYLKSLKILNSAKNDTERNYYFEILKIAQKGLNIR